MTTLLKRSALKILALALAVALWYFVSSDTMTATIKVPIEVKNFSEDVFLLSDLSEPVEVKVRGPEFLVASLLASPPSFKIKVPEVIGNISKNTVVKFSATELGIASPIEVLSIEPDKIELVYDQRALKKVKVQVPKFGSLQAGLSLESITLHPESLLISGPESELKKISSVETYPLDLGYIKDSTRLVLDLKKPNRLITLGFSEIEAEINLKQTTNGK